MKKQGFYTHLFTNISPWLKRQRFCLFDLFCFSNRRLCGEYEVMKELYNTSLHDSLRVEEKSTRNKWEWK